LRILEEVLIIYLPDGLIAKIGRIFFALSQLPITWNILIVSGHEGAKTSYPATRFWFTIALAYERKPSGGAMET